MKVLVGLNCDYEPAGTSAAHAFLYDRYVDMVTKAGAIPILLPHLTEQTDVEELLDPVDALVLTGCDDYDPALYGADPHPSRVPVAARKQQSDVWLATAALERGTPILGICGGTQILNVIRGGSLLQDIPSAISGALKHRKAPGEMELPTHPVRVERETRLFDIVTEDRIDTNSSHHQSIDRVAEGFRVSAQTSDGVIEAIEPVDGRAFIIGVQWHPEYTPEAKPTFSLMRALLSAAGRYRYGAASV